MTLGTAVTWLAASAAHAQTGGLGVVGPPRNNVTDHAAVVRTTTWCFSSGLRVMYEQQVGRPDISMLALVAGGSSADPPDREGLAHVAEHMWFRQPWVGESEAATGAYRNAWTNVDDTVFLTIANRRYVRDVLNVEARRLTEPLTVDPAVFEAEREVVRSELRQNWEDTAGVGLLALYPALFPAGHPYHHRPIGSHAGLDGLTPDQITAWAARTTPRDVAWSVVADFAPEKFAALLLEALPAELVGQAVDASVCAANAPPGAVAPREADPSAQLVEVPAAVSDRYVVVGWVLPPGDRETSLAEFDLWLMASAFPTEREADCGVTEMALANVGSCAFRLEPGEDPAGLTRKLLSRPAAWFEPNERLALGENYRRFVLASKGALFAALDVGSAVDEDALRRFYARGDPADLQARLSALAAPDWSEAAMFAARWFGPRSGYAAVVLVPDKSDRWPVALHSARDQPPPEAVTETADREKLVWLVSEPDLSREVRFTLSNGLQVHLLPWGNLPYARAALLFHEPDPGGVPLLPDYAIASISSLATDADLSGAALSALAHWSTARQDAHLVWQIVGPNATNLVALLAERLGQAHSKPIAPRAWLREELEARAEAPQSALSRAQELRARHLYPDRPVGLEPATLEAAAGLLTRRAANAYVADLLDPAGADLVVVGGFDPVAMEKAVRGQFSAWRNAALSAPAAPSPSPVPAGREVLVLPDELHRVLAHVSVACRIDGDSAGDVAWSILGNALDEDLNARIREREAASYGVHVAIDRELSGAALVVSTQVPQPAVGMAVGAILETLAAARSGMSDATLARWKLLTARRSALDWRTSSALYDWLVDAALHRVPETRATGLADRLALATPASVGAPLAPCVDAEVVTVVGDANAVTGSLDAASIAWTRP